MEPMRCEQVGISAFFSYCLRPMEFWAEAGAAKDAVRHRAAAIATDLLRRMENHFERMVNTPAPEHTRW
jgi:hypothetical protein